MGKRDVHKLSSEPMVSLILFGISSHENDYRLSWAMNDCLGFALTKSSNHCSFNQRLNENQEFSTYFFTDQESMNTYRLISNRCDNGFLLEELKNIDYLLLIEPIDEVFKISDVITKIKSIPFVAAIFPIEISSLKNKKRIL